LHPPSTSGMHPPSTSGTKQATPARPRNMALRIART
jgi:hypothetical protein